MQHEVHILVNYTGSTVFADQIRKRLHAGAFHLRCGHDDGEVVTCLLSTGVEQEQLHLPDMQEKTFEGGLRLPDSFVLGAHISFIIVLCPQTVFKEIYLKYQRAHRYERKSKY